VGTPPRGVPTERVERSQPMTLPPSQPATGQSPTVNSQATTFPTPPRWSTPNLDPDALSLTARGLGLHGGPSARTGDNPEVIPLPGGSPRTAIPPAAQTTQARPPPEHPEEPSRRSGPSLADKGRGRPFRRSRESCRDCVRRPFSLPGTEPRHLSSEEEGELVTAADCSCGPRWLSVWGPRQDEDPATSQESVVGFAASGWHRGTLGRASRIAAAGVRSRRTPSRWPRK
jgi:hypothetical protein